MTVHSLAALAAIIVVAALAQGAIHGGSLDLTAQVSTQSRAELGIEHTQPITLSLTVSTRGAHGIADISHDGTGTAYVSLPASWTRREVRGASLADASSDPPVFGFTRWHLPAGSMVSFDVPVPPSTILMHNPSGVPLQVKLTRVDVVNNTVEHDSILVKDVSVELW